MLLLMMTIVFCGPLMLFNWVCSWFIVDLVKEDSKYYDAFGTYTIIFIFAVLNIMLGFLFSTVLEFVYPGSVS